MGQQDGSLDFSHNRCHLFSLPGIVTALSCSVRVLLDQDNTMPEVEGDEQDTYHFLTLVGLGRSSPPLRLPWAAPPWIWHPFVPRGPIDSENGPKTAQNGRRAHELGGKA